MKGIIVEFKEPDYYFVCFEEEDYEDINTGLDKNETIGIEVNEKDLILNTVDGLPEYSNVILIRDREEYKKAGVSKGMNGIILDIYIDVYHVCFNGERYKDKETGIWLTKDIDIFVKERDLEIKN